MKIEIQASGENLEQIRAAIRSLETKMRDHPIASEWSTKLYEPDGAQASAVVVKEEEAELKGEG